MTGEAFRKVLVTITRLRDYKGLLVPANPGTACASSSIPIIFKPVLLWSLLWGDGGLTNNIPILDDDLTDKVKHVYVFVTPPDEIVEETGLISRLTNIVNAIFRKEYYQIKETGYFNKKNVTLIMGDSSLSGGLLNWSNDFELTEYMYQKTLEILDKEV
jgi:predicted acylesterase/phospholipase RssA